MNIRNIWLLSLSDTFEPKGEAHQLTTDGDFVREPQWTADGREILYASGNPLRSSIYRTPVDGSGHARLMASLGDGATQPALSAASRRLAYTRVFLNSNVWRLDTHAAGAPPERLISSTSREAFPQYSPDGTRIVFYSNRSGLNQVWMCDADGSRAAAVTAMEGTITGTPHWSPDGQRISFDSNTGGNWQIYVMDASGGKPRPLTSGPGTNVVSSWSRDGRSIYFMSHRTGEDQIWKAPVEGGPAVQVTRHGGSAALESADGRTLFFTKTTGGAENSVWRMPVGGSEEAMVVPSIHRYNFAVADTGLYYNTPTTPDQPSTIEFLDFRTGKVTKLYTLPRPVDLGLSVSPDKRYILFTQMDFIGSDLMLVENFK